MRKRRRTRLEIIADILSLVKRKRCNITEIIYKANLNSERAKRYVDFLLSKELMEVKRGSGKFYVITARGVEFVKDYMELKELERSLLRRLKKIEDFLS